MSDLLHFHADQAIDPLRFTALPASARKVYGAVRQHGPLTHRNLQERTQIPARTIRFAVRRLQDEGLIETRCSLHDCRTCYFFVRDRCEGMGANGTVSSPVTRPGPSALPMASQTV